jgi:signal transduction histidine kinase
MADDESQPPGKGILHPEGMQAVRDLASGVVHEVNNILGVIIGNAHLAKKNASNAEALEKYMGEVRAAAEEGRDLIRHLAALGGEESIRARALSLNDLVTNAVSELGISAELDLSTEDSTVLLDVWMAREALSGVARFMAKAKAVTSIRVATRVVGSAAALTIEDDGASPSDKELRALFAPFTKLDRRPKVGLELTNLADLASRSGGYVTAGVREPHGLRIVLTLPVSDGKASGDGPGVPLSKKGV